MFRMKNPSSCKKVKNEFATKNKNKIIEYIEKWKHFLLLFRCMYFNHLYFHYSNKFVTSFLIIYLSWKKNIKMTFGYREIVSIILQNVSIMSEYHYLIFFFFMIFSECNLIVITIRTVLLQIFTFKKLF